MNNKIVFEYKPKLWILLLAGFFCIAFAAIFILMAKTNDKGLIIYHLITLSVNGATIFYIACAFILFVGVFFIFLSLFKLFQGAKQVIITQDEIVAPKNWISKKIITVNYLDIKEFKMQGVQGQLFFYIIHKNGKLSIPSSLIATKDQFIELTELIVERWTKKIDPEGIIIED